MRQFNKKTRRDQAAFALWDSLDDKVFAQIPRDALKAAQSRMIGRIILPGDPAYNADRVLFNPAFNPFPAALADAK